MLDEEITPMVKTPWVPKQYQIVRLSEFDKRSKAIVFYPFLIDTITDSEAPKKDSKGNPIIETVKVNTTAKGAINVTRQVMEKTKLYSGTIFGSWMQFSQPRRGVKLADISPVEV